MDSGSLTRRDVPVLLVEEDHRVRKAMHLLFAALPDLGPMEAAHTTEAARDRMAVLSPGVAVVDLTPADLRPRLQLLRALRAAGWATLAMSAHSRMSSTALTNGASAFVDKGADPDEIVGLVRELKQRLHQRRARMASELLTKDCVYPESPRWHQNSLWFSDVHDYAVKKVDAHGGVELVVKVPGRPAGLGFLPDGRLLIAGALDRCLWVWDGVELQLVADLSEMTLGLLNDMVVDRLGRAYVGDTGFNLMSGEAAREGQVIMVDTRESTIAPRSVSADVWFPNGAVVSEDLCHYWVAESAANRISRFALAADGSLGERTAVIDLPDMPDGLCLLPNGDLWVALLKRGEFWRVDQDGMQREVEDADGRLAVACAVGGPDGATLFLCSAATTMADLAAGRSAGLIHTRPSAAPTDLP